MVDDKETFRVIREQATCKLLISALASHCAADENIIIDLLTGYLFDEEEANKIKKL